jgi:hypothetical protein
VNNVNKPAQIFKNAGIIINPDNHFLQINLIGKGKNTAAIGTQIQVKAGDEIFYLEQMPNRGFQSSVDPKLTIGLGKIVSIDLIRVLWPDGTYTELKNQTSNQLLTLKWEESGSLPEGQSFFTKPVGSFFQKDISTQLDFTHVENPAVDFDRDRLTYHMFSTEGPAFAKADLNGDGLEDLFFGGAKGFAGKIYFQERNGNFRDSKQEVFKTDELSEDTDAVFFDANADGFHDLLVCSGGNESGFGSPDLTDRLYLNDGKGNFTKSNQPGFAANIGSSSVVQVIDLNDDGAPDLFIGGRLVPFVYGAPASSSIWINDGKGNFSDQTAALAPSLKEIGMITDGKVVDYDGDGRQDLVLVGEWIAPIFLKNIGGKLEKTEMPEQANLKGWYRTIEIGDFDGNGLPDLVLGNHGLNTRFKASLVNPVKMYLNDFDQNGSIEHIFTRQEGNVQIPYTLKHELERQIPTIKKKYIRYSDYNDQSLEEIFPADVIAKSIIQEVNQFQSGVLLNQGNGKFDWKPLPTMAQKSWIFAIQILDLNGDGIQDLMLGGNLAQSKPETGKYDASFGEIMLGKGDGTFTFWPNAQHGLRLDGDVRAFTLLDQGKILVVKNSAAAEIWKYSDKK